MDEQGKRLRELIAQSSSIVFFGGAGVSTESGIPDFRSAHGLYSGAQGKSYEEMLSIGYFMSHQQEFWQFYKSVMLYPQAKPNAAHVALAKLERQHKLSHVLTQNIDGLHQAAGSQRVVELHGTVHSNSCMRCGARYGLDAVRNAKGVPKCEACGGDIRPDIVMYGEPLNEDVLSTAVSAIRGCDLLLVGGTSLVVHPAAGLLGYRKRGTNLVLINRDETPFDAQAQLVIHQNIADVLTHATSDQ